MAVRAVSYLRRCGLALGSITKTRDSQPDVLMVHRQQLQHSVRQKRRLLLSSLQMP